MSDDLFLKFDGVQGEAEDGRVHRDFDALGHQFGELGDDFVKLIDDASSTHGEAIHKVADDAQINHDLLKIDTAFLKIDDSFLKLDGDFLKFGDGITNFLENDLKMTPTSSSEGSSSLADTFHKLDSDFQDTGSALAEIGELGIGKFGGNVGERKRLPATREQFVRQVGTRQFSQAVELR